MNKTLTVPIVTYTKYYNIRTKQTEIEINAVHGYKDIRYAKITTRFGVQRCPEQPEKWSVVYTNPLARWSGAWLGVFDKLFQAKSVAYICENVLTDDAIEKYYAGKITKLVKQRAEVKRQMAALEQRPA